ncbi:MAG TPA: TorF family putative porin [Gallionella sp.]|nr:TorF family putative porin [Gallionella sp.]
MMKTKLLNSLMLAALVVPGVALAEEASPHTVSANVGFTTDYIFRGIAQTSHNPAVQGGIDYSHASGLYAGVWGSNVSWIADSGAVATGSVTMELDTYFGFRNSFAEDFTYDVGFIRYNYLGNYTPAAGFAKADTDEVYGAIGYKWLTAKYSYGLGKFLTVPGASGTNYLELNASVPVGDSGFTVGAHVGKQTYKGTAAAAFVNSATYTDYKLSVSKDIGGYVVGLSYTDTNASPFYTYPANGGDWGKATAALSVTHAF